MEDRMLSDEILLGIINSKSGGGGGGTDDYNDLKNQPQVNGNTLVGNKSASDLGLVAAENGKGLSTNDYTDADKAIVGGVTAALAGKQNTLTAGSYIRINDNDEISVKLFVLDGGVYKYDVYTNIYQTGAIVDKYDVTDQLISTRTYSREDLSTAVNIDDAFNFQYSGNTYSMTFLIASTESPAGTVVSWMFNNMEHHINSFELPPEENANDLIIREELDAVSSAVSAIKDGQSIDSFADVETALAGKQATLTFDSAPTDGSTNPVESNGVYDALATKQNATDNNLQTTDKTVVGAVNELKSGLTTVDVALSVPEGSGKNHIGMTLDRIKALNTTGVWSGNAYTMNGVTFTVDTDGNGRVIGIRTDGTASGGNVDFVFSDSIIVEPNTNYIVTGCPNGGGESTYRIRVYESTWVQTVYDQGSGFSFNSGTYTWTGARITVYNGVNVTGKTFYPMIRLASVSDPTFAPYIPSVESRIEAVESGLVNTAVTNNLESSGKVSSVGGNIVRNGQICFINIAITMSGQETSNWIELGTVPEPSYVVRADFVSDSASNIGTLRIQIDADGKFKAFYGGAGEYRVVLMYLITSGK